MNTPNDRYQGKELDLFEQAVRWKRYFGAKIAPHLRGSVLEVGAGQGGTTVALAPLVSTSWTCLEPDEQLLACIEKKINTGILPGHCTLVQGTINSMSASDQFGSILYIDVLEHIGDDRAELSNAASHLEKGGRIVVLSPAFNLLFSPFDKAVGHHRRYTKKSLEAAIPSNFTCITTCYLDSVGAALSLSNRILLRQRTPSTQQIHFWDNIVVPCSMIIDRVLGHSFGRSILGIWEKNA